MTPNKIKAEDCTVTGAIFDNILELSLKHESIVYITRFTFQKDQRTGTMCLEFADGRIAEIRRYKYMSAFEAQLFPCKTLPSLFSATSLGSKITNIMHMLCTRNFIIEKLQVDFEKERLRRLEEDKRHRIIIKRANYGRAMYAALTNVLQHHQENFDAQPELIKRAIVLYNSLSFFEDRMNIGR